MEISTVARLLAGLQPGPDQVLQHITRKSHNVLFKLYIMKHFPT